MPSLELKIPPPIVALVTAAVMWVLAVALPSLTFTVPWRVHLAGGFALLGGAIALAAVVAFRRSGTTINPMSPTRSSAIVTSGVFRFTRNPMYLGLVLVLIGWVLYLGAPVAMLGPMAFAAYMHRFQIVPEEKVLLSKFGAEYATYASKVRRWL